ncbi:MAG: nitrate reductase molybdenum cofactor assembly chaperone [Sphingomonadaceae bacterium]
MEAKRRLYGLLGELLEYPTPDLPARAAICRRLLADCLPEAASLLADFSAFVENTPLGDVEELYTATFDLAPLCSPYAGYQLAGEDDAKRTALMVRLQDLYRSAGFSPGGELPDHVAVLFRFLAVQGDAALQRDLVDDLLLPALRRMASLLEGKNAYEGVIGAAALVLASDPVGSHREVTALRPTEAGAGLAQPALSPTPAVDTDATGDNDDRS